ncbi:MAG TPA: 2-oxo acid dehydrogenase subunit E2 [Terriglobales bacterium]|nr:2-oxo acid dehydrogenase subunit E2 [Terriglobales bacterium]
MPAFRRPDGVFCRDVAPVRRIMPFLMRRRNESAVYHETLFDISRTRRWLKAYNRTHAQRATLFHLFAYACAQALHARPGLNRFVSGGHLYQRRDVTISFTAKREMSDEAPFVTVKVAFPTDEPFEPAVRRMVAAVHDARDGPARQVDREVAFVTRLPGPLVRALVGLERLLDGWNLTPAFLIGPDPMYASLFLANLGSVGLADTFHHLYEYGTVSIFGVLSAPRLAPVVVDRALAVRESMQVRWTFDERIHDAFYCAASLRIAQRIVEDPERHLGPPEAESNSLRAVALD